MRLISAKLTLALAALSLALLAPGRGVAQQFVAGGYSSPPAVTYYVPPQVYGRATQVSYYYAPTVSYYAPAVSYYPATVTYAVPAVSYYAAPAVSYYAAPAVSYYYAPATVTTTRYGLLGRPRFTSTYYYP
jgi:hypothetical protein